MKLKIGDNIKRLRKERNLTQEEFAQVLGVSYQSVSRWENNTCYPDIELIPVIAEYFCVSADKLMGVDHITEKAAVDEYLAKFQIAISKGDIEECIRIARAGVAEYPNNYALLNKLMYALFAAGSDDADIPDWKQNMESYDAEIVSIGERIIKYCPDTDIRMEATERLAFQHCEMGRVAQGRALYETMPSIVWCKEAAIWWALEEDEKLPRTQDLIKKSYEMLSMSMHTLSYLVSDRDAITVFEKIAELDALMYDGKPLLGTFHDCKAHYLVAKHALAIGDTDKAIAGIALATQAAIAFDQRSDERKTTSLLLGDVIVRREDFDTADSRPLYEILTESWLAGPEFDAIRETESFKSALKI